MRVFNCVIIAFTITNLISGDDNEELQSPSLESRVHLHSFYTSLPLSKDIELFVEYSPILNLTHFDGKVVEFDAMRWMNGQQTIHHKLPYLISNPALRTPHISAEWCQSNDFFKLGFRIYQTHREFGLPYQVKCATCHPIIEGLNTMFFLYPERDFTQSITKLSIGSREKVDRSDYCTYADCEQEPRVSNFQDFLRVNDLFFGEWSRWTGEHGTTDEDRELLGRPDGELSIHTRSSEGFTTMCGMELDEEIVSSNVFVNVDVITDTTDLEPSFTYGSYETLKVTVSSYNDTGLNLELFVQWETWGCCSACCCPPAICGHDFQTSSDCDNVFSARSRVGHLSIRRVSKLPIVLKQFSGILSKLLSIPPYTRTGIPVFSSLLAGSELRLAMKEITDTLIPPFLEANNASQYVFRTGMFLETESCKLHEQKTDCSKWAQCHNVSLAEINQEVSEMTSDSCQQVQFADVLVGVDPLKVRVAEHDNLRIRMDPEVHDMNKTAATWRVNLRKPKKYEKSRPCILQGIVQRNNEILILDFSSFGLKVDLILNSKQKVRIVFMNTKKQVDSQRMNYSILYWAAGIVVFFLLLITAVVLMHREKTRRLERRIKAKELHT